MVISFVMISTRPSMEKKVYNRLKKNQKIVEMHPLFGEFDLIVKIEGKDYDEIGKFVIDNIRSIDGVLNTQTLSGISLK